jgi:hypothetical protein
MASRNPLGRGAARTLRIKLILKSVEEVSGISMTAQTLPYASRKLGIVSKETIVNGRPGKISCLEIAGQTYAITRDVVNVVSLEDEWYDDVRDPIAVLDILSKSSGFKPDIFSFWQRVPDVEPRHPFHTEWEELAVLSITSYEHWWKNQIKSRVRTLIRKTAKEGIEIKEVAFDDEFVRGMTAIFNDAPVRQGRRSWHYGKSFETIKTQFSRFVYRETMIGAYLNGELIGFVMLGNAGNYGLTGEIIASVKHRDKAINNALVAKSVEICEREKLPYLLYFFWSDDSLAEFKRRCGFEPTKVPRYFVPLTLKGRLALKLSLHRGWKAAIPAGLKARLKKMRRAWNESRTAESTAATESTAVTES